MKTFNNYTCFGLLLNAIWLLSSKFNLLLDFIEDLYIGLGIILILIGLLLENHNMPQLKNLLIIKFLSKIIVRKNILTIILY